MSRSHLGLIVLLTLLASCASAPPAYSPRPAPVATPGGKVWVAELASRHGLTKSYEVERNRLLLSGAGHRVLLFPGTTVAVVNGERLPGMSRIGGESEGFTVTREDAARIERALAVRSIPIRSTALPRPAPSAAKPATLVKRTPAVARSSGDAAWRVPLKRKWRYILIHHSGTTSGNAARFDEYHREDRGWDGLGYDFVIGNGRGSKDGVVEVGYRWLKQLTGAHAGRADNGSNLMNATSIGICLVGNFQKRPPTPAQVRSLSRLVGFLRSYCGIPAENVLLHSDVRDTTCPGRKFPAAQFLLPAAKRAVPASFR